MYRTDLETPRLILRPWREADAEALYEYAGDPRVGPAAGWGVHPDAEFSRSIIRNVLTQPMTYAVCLKPSDRPIGSIGLMRPRISLPFRPGEALEAGYWLGVPYWGQGIIPEALRCLQEYAFTALGCTVLWCGYYEGNEKSKRCMEKCGFVFHHREYDKPVLGPDDLRTEVFTRLTREDWAAREGRA